MITNEELRVLARDAAREFSGNNPWASVDELAADVAAFARSMINMVLEDAAVELEREVDNAYAAELVRAMKVAS